MFVPCSVRALPPAGGGRTTPQLGEVYNNLGTLLHLLDRRTEASTAFRSSIAVAPRHALAYNNLANGLKAAACVDMNVHMCAVPQPCRSRAVRRGTHTGLLHAVRT
jgi:hypothetical protein